MYWDNFLYRVKLVWFGFTIRSVAGNIGMQENCFEEWNLTAGMEKDRKKCDEATANLIQARGIQFLNWIENRLFPVDIQFVNQF